MGYYILGIIILLLLIVFISDLLREARGSDDKFYRNISNPYPGDYDFYHEFAEENDFNIDEEEYLLEKGKRHNSQIEDWQDERETNNTEDLDH